MMSHWYFRPVLPRSRADARGARHRSAGLRRVGSAVAGAFAYDWPRCADVVDEVLDELGLERARAARPLDGRRRGAHAGGAPSRAGAAAGARRAAAIYPLPMPRSSASWPCSRWSASSCSSTRSRGASFARQMLHAALRCATAASRPTSWSTTCGRGSTAPAGATRPTPLHTLASLSDNNADPGRVRAPTLLVWGDEDRMIPLAHGKRLSRAIAGARLAIVPGCGHIPFTRAAGPSSCAGAPVPRRRRRTPLAETPIPPRRAQAASSPSG